MNMNRHNIFRLLLPVLAIVVFLAMTPVAKADAVYTLSASGTAIGDFSWSVSTPDLIAVTTNFTSFLSSTAPGGCTISGATINNPQTADPFIETFFTPACGGFTEVAQVFLSAGPIDHAGTYVPQGLTSPVWSLTVAAPEPSSLPLLGMGLLGVAGAGFLRRKSLAHCGA
jgi:hypothetical protein